MKKDKNGVPILPDTIEIDLEKAFEEPLDSRPLEICINFDKMMQEIDEALDETLHGCVMIIPRKDLDDGIQKET